jgi:hypothetical protein
LYRPGGVSIGAILSIASCLIVVLEVQVDLGRFRAFVPEPERDGRDVVLGDHEHRVGVPLMENSP